MVDRDTSLSDVPSILKRLEAAGSEENRAGMRRFGVETALAFGVPMAVIRPLSREIGRNHALSLALWDTGYHEARILAALIAEPARVTPEQMDEWVACFNSWDLCDQVTNIFIKTDHAAEKISEYVCNEREFVRRAGFAMIAWRAVHGKKLGDDVFLEDLRRVQAGAMDPRNFVKKAVNWALRQIGKRNLALNEAATHLATDLSASPDKTARWIGNNALKELTSAKTKERIAARAARGPSRSKRKHASQAAKEGH